MNTEDNGNDTPSPVKPAGSEPGQQLELFEADRAKLVSNHPIFTRQFEIATPPLIRTFDMIVNTVITGASSCAFAAHPRFGKTYAIDYCGRRLSELFHDIPIVTILGHLSSRPLDSTFYADFLGQLGRHDGRRKKPVTPLETVARDLWARAQVKNSFKLVLIIDEIQRLKSEELTWLADISNELKRLGIVLITISFGQPQLISLRSVLQVTQRGDLLSRFLSRVETFGGISAAAELQTVMACYDDPDEIQYPPGSNLSFSEFFLPKAYSSGWRLERSATICWKQFERHAQEKFKDRSKVDRLSIGMDWVCSAIRAFLMSMMDQDRAGLKVSADNWYKAIGETDFGDSLGFSYDPDRMP